MDEMTDDSAPLEGIAVVELSMYVQGPVAGLTLASLGADVVKIEQVGQEDHMRNLGGGFGVRLDERGKAWQYASLNRGKRSIALDITSDAGRPVFERMIEAADVFVTNLRERALERMNVAPRDLHAINPQLVYARGGGFGLRGPLAHDPCQDTVGMAYAGFMDVTSPSDRPNYPPGSQSDVLTGTAMASAVMAGLVKRATTGRGSVVGASQTQALMWMQQQPVGLTSTLGVRMKRFDPERPSSPLFNVYETADGWIAIAAIHPAQWPPLARAVGLDALLDDERYADFDSIIANRETFAPLLIDHLRTETTAHWWAALREAGVWVAPVNRTEDLARDENILANEYLVTFDDGFTGPPTPFDVDEFRGSRGLAAEYGEHTDSVLADLGYSDEEVLDLRVAGAIW